MAANTMVDEVASAANGTRSAVSAQSANRASSATIVLSRGPD
jgi:hypothetical protein